MSTWKTREARNRTELKVLAFLSESGQRIEGATAADIQNALVSDRMQLPKLADERIVLTELESAGLVERQQVATRGKAKPYFITDTGLQHLEKAKRDAISTEPGQQPNWSAKEVFSDIHQSISGIISNLPEFSTSGNDRVQEVSRKITQQIESLARRR